MQAPDAVIHRRLDLALRLVDTTTGNPPFPGIVRFYRKADLVPAMDKGGGCYIFIGLGREDFLMRIEVGGYDAIEVPVCYE